MIATTALTRRHALALFGAVSLAMFVPGMRHFAPAAATGLQEKFDFLSQNGNSNCSQAFLDSIPKMAPSARLQGSCCGPMNLHRYSEQIEGLKIHSAIPEIPPDPYDIEAGLAQRLLAAYDIALPPDFQAVYDDAFKKSDEGGPCCCQCWRWHVLGGMGKLLVRDRGFDATTLGKLWDLTDGCGGDKHVH